jgi:hypothetical protein
MLADTTFVALIAVFFALAAAYVRACQRIG